MGAEELLALEGGSLSRKAPMSPFKVSVLSIALPKVATEVELLAPQAAVEVVAAWVEARGAPRQVLEVEVVAAMVGQGERAMKEGVVVED
jgi:hypothetical protein